MAKKKPTKKKQDGRFISEEKLALIRSLRDGLGIKSPSGKDKWTNAEIAAHPKINTSRQALYGALKRRGELPNQIESVEDRKKKELTTIQMIKDGFLQEILGRDHTKTPTDKLVWSFGVLYDKAKDLQNKQEEVLNVVSLLQDLDAKIQIEFKERKMENAKAIDVEAVEVKDE